MISKTNPVTVVLLAQPSMPPPQGDQADSRARLKRAFRADGLLLATFCEWATFFDRGTWHQKRIVHSNPFPALSVALLPPVSEKFRNWKSKFWHLLVKYFPCFPGLKSLNLPPCGFSIIRWQSKFWMYKNQWKALAFEVVTQWFPTNLTVHNAHLC